MEHKRPPLALMLFVSLSFSACGGQSLRPPVDPKVDAAPAGRTLYERLGGEEGVDAIGDTFLKKLVADSRVRDFFKNSKGGLSRFKQQLCQISGGPCQYGGKDMKTAHGGMGISDMQFDAFVEDFTSALDEKGVSPRDKSEILAAFVPMRSDIVEKNERK
jgi:hemoglobin